MKTSPLEDKITHLAEPVITDLGFSLTCVRISGENGAALVQVMAEDPATRRLGVDDCAKISRALSAIFDVEDPIKGAYRLEVSSPGIDRLLIRKKDFEDFAGFEAKLETYTPSENGQKRFKGVLKGINNDNVLVQTETGDIEIPYAELSKAKLVLTDELIKATANL
jgi:ribosome maturation factor RimP